MSFFTRLEKIIQECVWNPKRLHISKARWGKESTKTQCVETCHGTSHVCVNLKKKIEKNKKKYPSNDQERKMEIRKCKFSNEYTVL